jgi:hypothetical protein
MPVLYYKEDYAILEINLEGDYVLRVFGVGSDRVDFALILEDDELDRYREWGEHFVVTMAHRIHRDPGQYADRNILTVPAGARVVPPPAAPVRKPKRPAWAIGAAAVAGVLLVWAALVLVAVDRPGAGVEYVVGRTSGLHSAPDDVGDVFFMTVQLDDGTSVQVRIPRKADYRENAAVTLAASKASFFGNRSFRFRGYR